MKLEDQVCSLELAKRLKELSVKQTSLCFWNKYADEFELYSWGNVSAGTFLESYSAFTVAELGEMLPRLIETKNSEFPFYYNRSSREHSYYKSYYITDAGRYFHNEIAEKEADARAKMLIHLLENKLMEPPK